MDAKAAALLRNRPALVSTSKPFATWKTRHSKYISELTPTQTEKIEAYKNVIIAHFEALAKLASVRFVPG
jgi:hypothetical protein